ncbi:HAD family hydrolase [Candidatus Bathyarchaeota archaeon]|nr:HAD family hydrolase [Candidatus Bathyarchaeota archaeon]
MLFEAVIFDLDGTLIISKVDYGEMRRRVSRILIDAGVPGDLLTSSLRIWEIISAGEGVLRGEGMPDGEWMQLIERINQELNDVELAALETVMPAPHAEEALRRLKGMELLVGVATRSCRAYADKSLELTGLRGFVDALVARDDVEHPKPDPRHLLKAVEALGSSPDRVIYVGDTTTDFKTAIDAGINFVGYVGNEEWGRRLREAGCQLLIDDLRDVIKIVAGRGRPLGRGS